MVAGKIVFCFDYIHSFTQICKNVFKQFLWYKNETKKNPLISWSSAGLLTPVGSGIQTLLRDF